MDDHDVTIDEPKSLWERLRRLVGAGERHGPPVGLALSGGVVRGAAHVGVLEVLDREGIEIDLVAGTSAGAILGAGYAAGVSPETLLAEFERLNWFSIAAPTLDLDFRGLLDTRPLERLLRDRFGLTTFDALKRPFRAVACDIDSGERVVLSEGDVVQAVLASSAMAGLFKPIDLDGRQLIDGGYLDNLPLDVAQEMGARTIIAVDLLADTLSAPVPTNFVEIFQRVLFMMIEANQARANAQVAREAPEASVVTIRPDLAGLSFSDFDDVRALYERGRKAAEAALPRIREAIGDG